MLFHCYWPEEWPTLLVEADDQASASSAAAKYNGGNAPSLVTPLRELGAAVVVCEVHMDQPDPDDVPEGEDPETFVVATLEPPDDLEDVLIELEEKGLDVAGDELGETQSGEVAAVCGDTMADEGEGGTGGLLVCMLPAEHDGDHQGQDERGELAAWPQEG